MVLIIKNKLKKTQIYQQFYRMKNLLNFWLYTSQKFEKFYGQLFKVIENYTTKIEKECTLPKKN